MTEIWIAWALDYSGCYYEGEYPSLNFVIAKSKKEAFDKFQAEHGRKYPNVEMRVLE